MDPRPGTSSGRPVTSSGRPPTSSGPVRRRYGRPPSSANDNPQLADPSVTSYGPPSTGYGPSEYEDDAVFGHYPPDALYEEDEEDESSDDGDVFAYLPPTTAEQQLDQDQEPPAHPPLSSDSQPFQYSPGDTGAFAHDVPEGDPPSYPPQYPGTSTSPAYPQLGSAVTQSTDSDKISRQPSTSPSHPPPALLQSRAPKAFSSPHIASTPPISPYSPIHPTSLQQPFVPGDAYRMREIQPPSSALPPSTAEHATTRRTDPSSPPNPSSGGTGAGGRVSITTHSGLSSRSREVHVTLPPGRTSPPSDIDISALPSPVADVGPGAPARVAALAPSTPISDIDQLSYDDSRKAYSRQTTGDSSVQSRKRRRQRTASSLGGVSVDDRYEDYIYDDEWAHNHPGMSIKDDKGAASSSYSTPSMGALEAGSPHLGYQGRGTIGPAHDHRTGTANSNGGLGEGQVVNGSYVLGTGGLEDDDEDSPYPEVRASVSNIDDPEMPVLTLRMWILGLSLCIAGAGANTFFNFRYPAPSIAPLVLLLIAHPCGKFLAYTMPIESFVIRIPRWMVVAWWKIKGVFTLREWRRRRHEGVATALVASRKEEGDIIPWVWEIHLNPGPFNIKEHVLIYIMTNVSVYPAYALNATVVAHVNYHINLGSGFSFLVVIATQLAGFGIAGMCRRFLVWPASLIWPQNLVACTLLNTLHAEDDEGSSGITRYRFFVICTGCAFVWCFFPSFIFQALSAFSWICWFRPNDVVVNQLFGVVSGLGMGILTFDWNQIAFIGSPLMIPWWAEVHIMIGFVLLYWLVVPLLYYTNVWHFAHFPIMGNSPYDRFGNMYNVTRVVNTHDNSFNLTAYDEYSPMYLTINYAMTYLLAFALTTCIIVHTALYHGPALLKGFKRMKTEDDDVHAKLMRYYPEVPDWWYGCIFVVFFLMGLFPITLYPTGIPFWSLFVAIIFPFVYVLPAGFVYAYTAQSVSINFISESVAGVMFPGRPLTNMIFKAYSTQTMAVAINFVQDLKLGHYIKVPPRATFIAQFVATFITAVVQVGIQQSLFRNVKDICSPHQPAHLTCPHTQVFFSSSAVWGVIGPTRQFGPHALYKPELYALVVGAVLPIPFWLWQKRYPQSWLKYFSMPVLLNGPGSIPPALGINYSSWFVVAFIFQYVIRRRSFRWWSKFNYILSSALDSGTTIALILMFLTLQLPKGGKIAINWWGNSVYMQTADGNSVAYKPGPF